MCGIVDMVFLARSPSPGQNTYLSLFFVPYSVRMHTHRMLETAVSQAVDGVRATSKHPALEREKQSAQVL